MRIDFTPKKYYDAIDTGDSAAIIAGSSQLASTALGAFAQSNLNNATKNFDIQMYQQQRTDALSDWNRQNAYNSPTAQMQRFQAAGLNPNLIYGNNSTNAAPVRSSTVPQWSPKTPDYSGIAQGVGNALSVKTQQLQLNNLAEQNQLLQSQQKNIDADTQNKISQNPGYGITQTGQELDNKLKQQTLQISVALATDNEQQAREQLTKTLADTEFTLDKNDREAASNAVTIKQGLQQILQSKSQVAVNDQSIINAKQQLANAKLSNELDQQDLRLKKLNISPNSPTWEKILGTYLNAMGIDTNPNPKGKLPVTPMNVSDKINSGIKSALDYLMPKE